MKKNATATTFRFVATFSILLLCTGFVYAGETADALLEAALRCKLATSDISTFIGAAERITGQIIKKNDADELCISRRALVAVISLYPSRELYLSDYDSCQMDLLYLSNMYIRPLKGNKQYDVHRIVQTLGAIRQRLAAERARHPGLMPMRIGDVALNEKMEDVIKNNGIAKEHNDRLRRYDRCMKEIDGSIMQAITNYASLCGMNEDVLTDLCLSLVAAGFDYPQIEFICKDILVDGSRMKVPAVIDGMFRDLLKDKDATPDN